MPPPAAPPPDPLRIRAEAASEIEADGRVRIAFTAAGAARPGVWSPAFGRPAPLPLEPDGPGRWRREVRLPAAAGASWAGLAEVRAARPSRARRLGALLSPTARAGLARRLDERFRTPEASLPSLYRLLGAPAEIGLPANVALLPLPLAEPFDPAALCRPAAAGRALPIGRHRYTRRGEGDEALLLDGEVLRRCDADLAATGWARGYLDNRGAAERFRALARPLALARGLAPGLAEAGCAPRLVAGASAAAPLALELALLLGARRAVLLSPVFRNRRLHERLLARVAASPLAVEVYAGSEERAGPGGGPDDAERCLLTRAAAFAARLREAGVRARFHEFPGGHDLPAWRSALLGALREAAAPARRDEAPE